MAALSWEEFDAALAAGVVPVRENVAVLRKHGVDGSRTLEEIAAANPRIRITRCPPAIAKGAIFMGGKPTLPPRAANDNHKPRAARKRAA